MHSNKPFEVLHVIKQINSGGGTLGLLNQCLLSKEHVYHYVYSISPPQGASIIDKFTSSGAIVVSDKELQNISKTVDIIQIEWWNNPEINNFIVNTSFPKCRLVLYIRVNCDAPLMCPSLDLLQRVDFCITNAPLSGQSRILSHLKTIGMPAPKIVFSGAKPPEHLLEQKYGNSVTFGYVGTVDSIKIYPDFLDLIEEILKSVPHAIFRFAGEGLLDEYRAECEKRNISASVEFLDHVENVYDFLEETDIFFYPLNKFTYAASEKALQEAMLAGLPCVVFLHGGIVHLLEHNQIGVTMDKAKFISDAIALAGSPTLRKKVGSTNHSKISKLSWWNNMLKDLLEAYENILEIVPSAKNSLDMDMSKILKFSIDHSEFADQKKSKDAIYLINFIQDLYSNHTRC